MHRKPIIAANWKMNTAPQGWNAEDSPYKEREGADVIVFPSLLDLPSCLETFLTVGAQAGRPELHGAFTGDVSMQMLTAHGCRYVLCGHSERRMHHGENDAFIALQMQAAEAAGLVPVLCVGESADERTAGRAQEVVRHQMTSADGTGAIIAYEPIWAIGTGNTASAQDAQEMHAFIRSLLPENKQGDTHILYGGSVKPDNAAALIAQEDIDGFLVGGASLIPADFRKIVDACTEKA